MKHWLWIILLFPVSPLVAGDKKLGGYVLDAAAFRKIQTYCIDTRNLPPREVLMTDAIEGRSEGFATDVLEHDALYYTVRILVRDWQKLSEPLRAATP